MNYQFSLQEWANVPLEIYNEEEYFEAEVLPLIYQLRDKCAARNLPMTTMVEYSNKTPSHSDTLFVANASLMRSSYAQIAIIQIVQADSVRDAVQGFAWVTAAYKAKPESPTH